MTMPSEPSVPPGENTSGEAAAQKNAAAANTAGKSDAGPNSAAASGAAANGAAANADEGNASPREAPGRRPRSRRLTVCLVVAALGAMVAAGTWAGSRHFYQPMRVTGTSMEPTYAPGASVRVRKESGARPHRGDVVTVTEPEWGMAGPYLKRVIGVGGDHVVLPRFGPLTVNGRKVTEPYVLGGVVNGITDVDVTVPAGRLFLLGDHRVDSIDARMHLDQSHGTLPDSDIVGRVLPDNRAVVPYFTVSVVAALVAMVAAAMALGTWRATRRRTRPTRTTT